MSGNDAELVQKCLAGDELSQRALIQQFQQSVFGLCLRMLNQREDAEDTTQEVFLRVFRSLHRWDPTRTLKPWILTIAANRCRTLLEKRKRIPLPTEHIELSDDAGSPLRGYDLAEELQLALAQLRDDYRLCFILFHQENLSCFEISDCMEVPEGTIKTWLHRARHQLATTLQRRGIVPNTTGETPS